jgi:hypothetical protein
MKGRINPMMVSSALRLLRRAGHVEFDRGERDKLTIVDVGPRLRVDWRELETRRKHDDTKVMKVIFYATQDRCRTLDILSYFGSRASFKNGCGHCDRCSPPPPYATAALAPARPKLVPGHTHPRGVHAGSIRPSPGPASAVGKGSVGKSSPSATKAAARPPVMAAPTGPDRLGSVAPGGARGGVHEVGAAFAGAVPPIQTADAPLTVARKVFACVARGRQSLPPLLVARVLQGSKAREVVDHGHDKNSTYGLLSALSLLQLQALLDVLQGAGLLRLQHQALGLSEEAVAVMKGERGLPEATQAQLDALFLREEPAVVEARQRLKAEAPSDDDAGAEVTPTIATTLAMLMAGQDVWEVAKARDVKPQTITKHVIVAARAGAARALDFEPYLDPALLDAVRKVAPEVSWEESLKDFRDRAADQVGRRKIDYEHLKMHIAYLIREGELR